MVIYKIWDLVHFSRLRISQRQEHMSTMAKCLRLALSASSKFLQGHSSLKLAQSSLLRLNSCQSALTRQISAAVILPHHRRSTPTLTAVTSYTCKPQRRLLQTEGESETENCTHLLHFMIRFYLRKENSEAWRMLALFLMIVDTADNHEFMTVSSLPPPPTPPQHPGPQTTSASLTDTSNEYPQSPSSWFIWPSCSIGLTVFRGVVGKGTGMLQPKMYPAKYEFALFQNWTAQRWNCLFWMGCLILLSRMASALSHHYGGMEWVTT